MVCIRGIEYCILLFCRMFVYSAFANFCFVRKYLLTLFFEFFIFLFLFFYFFLFVVRIDF
jgi:hypothetical protein